MWRSTFPGLTQNTPGYLGMVERSQVDLASQIQWVTEKMPCSAWKKYCGHDDNAKNNSSSGSNGENVVALTSSEELVCSMIEQQCR